MSAAMAAHAAIMSAAAGAMGVPQDQITWVDWRADVAAGELHMDVYAPTGDPQHIQLSPAAFTAVRVLVDEQWPDRPWGEFDTVEGTVSVEGMDYWRSTR